MVLPDGAFILRLTDRCTEDAMKDDNAKLVRTNRVWLAEESCDLDEFRKIVERSVKSADYPLASDVVANVPVYDGLKVHNAATSPESRKDITAEWVEALTDGPGVIFIRGAFADMTAIDKANDHFWAIIEEERLNNVGGGDHFAKPGANDRIWNALEKLCLRDPATFAAYYGNAIIALVSEAWLGPAYQITSQLNVVNPGGAAQLPHRDYHLGFQSPQAIERFPVHVHRLSPMLTLQGAIAHCDMPLETGRRSICRSRKATCKATWRPRGQSFATISRPITSSSRSPRATQCSSILPSSMPPERTARRMCAASPISCRSHRLSGARWRASTGSR